MSPLYCMGWRVVSILCTEYCLSTDGVWGIVLGKGHWKDLVYQVSGDTYQQ